MLLWVWQGTREESVHATCGYDWVRTWDSIMLPVVMIEWEHENTQYMLPVGMTEWEHEKTLTQYMLPVCMTK